MPVTFLNGNAPLYLGHQFTTSIDLIDTIESTLVTAGWTSLEKVSETSLFIRGVTTNNHNCWIEFIISGETTAKTLIMRGWLEAVKTNGSPNSIHTLTYTEESLNRLWLSADQDAFCISLYNATGAMDGYHAGFLERTEPTDATAWMIGRIISYPSYNTAYVARARHNQPSGVAWRQLSADFNAYTNPSNISTTIPLSTLNFNSRNFFGIGGSDPFISTTASNIFFGADIGRRTRLNQCKITPYFYLEGLGSTTTYGSGMNGDLWDRGNVKFAYCGVSQEASATQIIDDQTGYRILSVGTNTSKNARQGMRIL